MTDTTRERLPSAVIARLPFDHAAFHASMATFTNLQQEDMRPEIRRARSAYKLIRRRMRPAHRALVERSLDMLEALSIMRPEFRQVLGADLRAQLDSMNAQLFGS